MLEPVGRGLLTLYLGLLRLDLGLLTLNPSGDYSNDNGCDSDDRSQQGLKDMCDLNPVD